MNSTTAPHSTTTTSNLPEVSETPSGIPSHKSSRLASILVAQHVAEILNGPLYTTEHLQDVNNHLQKSSGFVPKHFSALVKDHWEIVRADVRASARRT